MATNKNASGLRILWIPGRKRHNRKGHVDATNKHIDYNRQHKQNQQWSLGGSKGHANLMSGSAVVDVVPVAGYAGAKAIQHIENKKEINQILTDHKNEIDEECNSNQREKPKDNDFKELKRKKTDDKVVNYLYYSLMCCECSIS